MANKHQKIQKQQEKQPTPQPTAPAAQPELSEEELGQVVGGGVIMPYSPSAPTPNPIFTLRCPPS
jgi:hypothetical protein